VYYFYRPEQEFPIDYCLSQNAGEHCTLLYSLNIFVIIIVCDVIKLISMACILTEAVRAKSNNDSAIITVLGDGIQSFLEKPDETSADRCLITQRQIRAVDRDSATDMKYQPYRSLKHLPIKERIQKKSAVFGPRPLPWYPSNKRWLCVPSRSRWLVFAGLFTVILIPTALVFNSCISRPQQKNQSLWQQGIGTIDPNSVFTNSFFDSLDAPSQLLRDAIVINTPQLLFSFLYFVYNGLFTCMRTGAEWGQFSRKRTTLRVSEPRGQQRSTYWLSLPWRYSIPFTLISALLHWLLSRSLFLVWISVYGPDGEAQQGLDISACGFSPLAILLVMVILMVSLLVVAIFAARKLDPAIPVVGTCSWALSAACHDTGGEVDAALKPLLWGVVDSGDERRAGHCTITSREVEKPFHGQLYQ
jgi:hypothetical protein